MTRPAFIPPELISLHDLYEEVDAGDLGALLAGGSIVALYYLEATGFSRVPQQIWLGEHGRAIIDTGIISEDIATRQLGVWTRGEDLSVFISRSDLEPFIEAIASEGAPDEASSQPRQRPMSRADLVKAAELLKAESQTKRMTRAEQRIWLRQAFVAQEITEDNFRNIFKEVPVGIGRPKKADKKV